MDTTASPIGKQVASITFCALRHDLMTNMKWVTPNNEYDHNANDRGRGSGLVVTRVAIPINLKYMTEMKGNAAEATCCCIK